MARRDAGFTLVEMLVSLVLLGMAGALVVEGFASGDHLWRATERGAARGEAVEAAQTVLRGRIEGLRPATLFDAGRPFADIDGQPNAFAFIALPLESERPAPMRRYRLSRGPGGDLVLGWTSAETRDGEMKDEVLLHDIDRLEIDYFGAPSPADAERWRDAWSRIAAPPRLVRIRLTFPPGDRRVWPELIVRPAASVDTLCVIDPLTATCRGRT